MRIGRICLIGMLCILFAKTSFAWVFPEHRRLTELAIRQMEASLQSRLLVLWQEIRKGHENRLTEMPWTAHSKKYTAVDFASWPAIAGDHSCSPSQLMQSVSSDDWILQVMAVSDRLETDILQAKSESQLENAIHYSDLRLLRADDQYVNRAGANQVHFLLPRTAAGMQANEYFEKCISAGTPLNALGAYVWYHNLALQAAAAYRSRSGEASSSAEMLWKALAREAFALHFLQDAFAAGHLAGTWGKTAEQKGTHDHYNKTGVEIQTWNGIRTVVKGDAYLDSATAAMIAAVVAESLSQVVKATLVTAGSINGNADSSDLFNLCANTTFPAGSHFDHSLYNILIKTPLPGLADGAGALPRFHSEVGPFLGIVSALEGSSVSGGFGKTQTAIGYAGGLAAGIRLGYGLEGVLNKSGDGLAFIQFGWRYESASSNNISNNTSSAVTNSIVSVLPARSALNITLRVPYFLVPGDLVIASPVLAVFAPKALNRMATSAVNGGLLKWQYGINTKIGRFQFVLGREVSLTLFGLKNPRDFLILPKSDTSVNIIEYRSTRLDFPVFEYRPFRKFSEDQASSMFLQMGFGIDMPYRASVLAPVGDPTPALKNVWHINLRIGFQWRRYL